MYCSFHHHLLLLTPTKNAHSSYCHTPLWGYSCSRVTALFRKPEVHSTERGGGLFIQKEIPDHGPSLVHFYVNEDSKSSQFGAKSTILIVWNGATLMGEDANETIAAGSTSYIRYKKMSNIACHQGNVNCYITVLLLKQQIDTHWQQQLLVRLK